MIQCNQLVGHILGLYDRINQLEAQLGKASNNRPGSTVDEKYDAYMVSEGREAVFNRHFMRSIARVDAHFTEEGSLVFDSFEAFVDKYLLTVPDYFSRDDFKAYFDHLLRDIYEECKAEAIEALKNTETTEE